jgi:hypothetical protein
MLVCFSAPHRGGHKLWNLDGSEGKPSKEERAELAGALRDVYVACDEALGRLLDAGGDGCSVLVFSLHGMGPNICRSDLLPELLRRILTSDSPPPPLSPLRRLGSRLREALPIRLRNEIKSRLPMVLQDRLTAYWRTGGIDWKSTPAFALASDLQGYVRINLKGREREGIVDPGDEYDNLCTTIEDGLRSFVDADSGEPLVADVGRASEIFPPGDRHPGLPDMVVRWNPNPASAHREITSGLYGSVPWPTPGKHPSGRSGNHRAEGFLVASGPSIPRGPLRNEAHIQDLLPTIHALLGLPADSSTPGKSLLPERGGA